MYRIDNAKSADALPTPAAPGPNVDGYFDTGTIVTSDWLNAIQEEMCYVIAQAGLGALDKTDSTQFYDAIQELVDQGPAVSGISAVVEDTSPSLGGDLHVNGFKFNSASNGDVIVTTTGRLFLDCLTILIHTYIYHYGDLDNYIQFGTDTINFVTGGTSRLDVSDTGVRIGGGGARVTTCYNDSTMSADSDTALTSQAAFKAYADNKFANVARGNIIASTLYIYSPDNPAKTRNQWDGWTYHDEASVSTPVAERFTCPHSGVIKNMFGNMSCYTAGGAPAANMATSVVVTLYKNDVATSLTYTIASGRARQTNFAFNATGINISVAAGDYLYIRTVQSAGASGSSQEVYYGSASFEYTF